TPIIKVLDSHHDLAGAGTTVSGAQGATVNVAIGAKNLGPAALDSTRANLPAVQTFFTVPPGTTAVTAPQICFSVVDLGNGQTTEERGKPGGHYYHCWPGPTLLVPGKSALATFALRIDSVTTSTTGKSSVDDTFEAPKVYQDDNAADNTADVVVNLSTS